MTIRSVILLFLCLVLTAAPAEAADDKTLGIAGQAAAASMTGIDDGRGKAGWWKTGFSVSYSYFTLNYETRIFSWSDRENLPFGNQKDDPWESLSKIGLNFKYTGMVGPKWGYFTGGGLISAFEDRMDASWAGWAYGGIVFVVSPDLQIRAGAVGCLDHVDAQALPLLGLDYKAGATEGLSFSLGIPETDFHYGFTPRLGVRLNFSFDQFTYRLADGSSVMKKGYLRQQEAVAALRLEYRPLEGLLICAGPEYHFLGKFMLYDRDGDKFDEYDLDPSLGAGLGIVYNF